MEYILLIAIVIIAAYIYSSSKKKNQNQAQSEQSQEPLHFDLLDENGDPIKKPKVEVTVGGGSDAPVQELQYFCVKDKGYHVTVWPKDYHQFDIVRFNIAGIEYRENIDNYLGEFQGRLEEEPTNEYDPNAIKVLADDGHHVGYVPRDMTTKVRKNATLPCSCYCYIGTNNGTFFSDCYVVIK